MDGVVEVNLENSGPMAVDTPSGGAGKNHNALIGTPCKNCGTILTGDYCHACGQSAYVHRSFRHVLEEVVHGITHLDSKTWRSLPMLVFRPGTMTRNYVMGHRSRYVPPSTMFLGSIFAMFLAFAFAGGPSFIRPNTATAEAKSATTAAVATSDQLATANPAGNPAKSKEKQLSELAAEREAAVASGDKVAVAAVDAAAALVKDAPEEAITGEAKVVTIEGEDFQSSFARFLKEDVKIDTPWPTINKKIKHKLENPELFLYKLQNTVYKFSFLLIPISLPFIWLLLFWKRGVTLYDHAVFALYSVSFMSFFFLALALSSRWITWSEHAGWMLLAVLGHTYFQFKGAYALNWFSAFWRTAIFVFLFAPITLSIFFTSIIILGAVG